MSRFNNIPYEQSDWVPIRQARTVFTGSDRPGVYLARWAYAGGGTEGQAKDSTSSAYDEVDVFYVGYSASRVRQRVGEYVGGNDLNGLAEIMLDLAFADADWIRDRLTRLEGGETIRARQWMIDAVEHRISIQVSLLTTGS